MEAGIFEKNPSNINDWDFSDQITIYVGWYNSTFAWYNFNPILENWIWHDPLDLILKTEALVKLTLLYLEILKRKVRNKA